VVLLKWNCRSTTIVPAIATPATGMLGDTFHDGISIPCSQASLLRRLSAACERSSPDLVRRVVSCS
jgi:hypothetical protein